MKAEEARTIATEVVGALAPYCGRISIAGSLRRRREEVGDVDLVAVPIDREGLQRTVEQKFMLLRNGGKLKAFVCRGKQVDLYLTEPEGFEATLMHRTGSIGHNIGIAIAAAKRGLHLSISKGLVNEEGEVVAKTERGIFGTLGLEYKEPWERE